ncbi:molybdopterin-dependent oxidoreductase [Tropicimonas sp. IMCC34043]|uniref:molybdopterin-dependent oxidoreductase n=1 Tax=Tropicimonas sp. IMCC34043 TaxID=2248760 RepID=UPI000E24B275|nr:molybdopterin-dependent oxidoreductase [Tropicimonas sp. IMCC34043]
MDRRAISLCHWGPFEARVRDGRLVETRPLPGSGADPEMIGAWPRMLYSESRITTPHVRKGFLDHGIRSGGAGRGREEMVPVDWDTALDLVAGELARVHTDHGPHAIFGGSYGWSSAGRFHHARSQVRRFLAAAGGFTDQIGNYSWGAAQAILPHVLGDFDAVARDATSWETIAAETDVVVAFGGLNPKNWRVTSGGAGAHHMPQAIADAQARGTRFIVISPMADDIPPGLQADLIRPRPGSDTAIMLALAFQAVATGRADCDFLARYTTGHDRFLAYLKGETDGQPKTLDWAAGIADVPVADLQALWQAIARGRVMLTAAWSLQRADHGEQPFWALIALAAMLGQIGLPGGGFCFGYGSMNAVGADSRKGFVPALPGLPNTNGMALPVASFAEALMEPGRQIAFDGRRITFPDIRLVYWAGGNPFHHAQDLSMVEQAWRRPETIVVHEPWWTPTAQRADIVLPATTPLERNDLGGTSRDPSILAMPKLVEPLGDAWNDFDIFCALADRLGCRATFDEGLDEAGWLRRLWTQTEARGAREGIEVPEFDSFWQAGVWKVPPPEAPEVLLDRFREDPAKNPLRTPSGRIELFSETVAGFGYADCPPHPVWLEPAEWLGAAQQDELHLVTNQPARQLHSQIWPAGSHPLPGAVHINPEDARLRGIAEGAMTRLQNARGACRATARIDPTLRQGVVVMATGAWYEPDPATGIERNGNPNVLTSDRRTSRLGQACAALSALVRIEPLGATTAEELEGTI